MLSTMPCPRLDHYEPRKRLQLQAREALRLELVVFERLPRHRCDGAHDLRHRLPIYPYLVLRVRIESQLEEVKDVVQIALPVPLGVLRHAEIDARQLAAKIPGEHLLVALAHH